MLLELASVAQADEFAQLRVILRDDVAHPLDRQRRQAVDQSNEQIVGRGPWPPAGQQRLGQIRVGHGEHEPAIGRPGAARPAPRSG